MTIETVPASEVREGDWVRWPDDSDTVRRITDLRALPYVTDGQPTRVYVEAHSEYDAYEYEWLNTQPVVVWRGL